MLFDECEVIEAVLALGHMVAERQQLSKLPLTPNLLLSRGIIECQCRDRIWGH